MSSDCLFCKIVAGEIPCRKVYEDADTLAFLDINPWNTGHTLVIPRRHVESVLSEVDALAGVAAQVGEVARLLVERLDADGANIVSSAGSVAGQEVFHLHVHVVPRYRDTPGLQGLVGSSHDDLDQVLARINPPA